MADYVHPEMLVETDWVRDNLGKPGIKLVEIDVDTKAYDAGHIAVAYREVVKTVRDRVKAAIDAGKSADEIVAARPSADFDAKWGGGFMKPDVFVQIVYTSLAGE